MSIKDDVKVDFLHVCENALISQDGKLSVINIFNQIRTDGFPIVYPKFSIVSSIRGKIGKYTEEIQIKSQAGVLIASVKNEQVEIKDDDGSANFMANIVGFVFPNPDAYSISILINGEEMDTKGLIDVKKI